MSTVHNLGSRLAIEHNQRTVDIVSGTKITTLA